jgi:D-amino-acid dehydrogenase
LKILVIGGGLLGLCSAHVLLERGHQVQLLEVLDGVGRQTSFANGGLLTPSRSEPWNGPDAVRHLISSAFTKSSAFRLRARAIPSLIPWGIGFLRHSTPARQMSSIKANFDLATYSKRKTIELQIRLDLKFDFVSAGTMNVYRNGESIEAVRHQGEYLSQFGMRYQELDVDGAISTEPTLEHARHLIKGAFYYPDDVSGDAHLFCRELAREIVSAGAVVRTGITVTRLATKKGALIGTEIGSDLTQADAVVMAAGHQSPALVRSAGLRLPVRPAKGYSLTLDVEGLDGLPRIPLIDESMHAAITPLGNRLRMTSTVEFAGLDKRIDASRIDSLFSLLGELYPRIASQIDRGSANPWAGLRPVSSDGKPYIGQTRIPGHYVNAGHGPLGWTMAMGSAYLLADRIDGRPAEIDGTPFSPVG